MFASYPLPEPDTGAVNYSVVVSPVRVLRIEGRIETDLCVTGSTCDGTVTANQLQVRVRDVPQRPG